MSKQIVVEYVFRDLSYNLIVKYNDLYSKRLSEKVIGIQGRIV